MLLSIHAVPYTSITITYPLLCCLKTTKIEFYHLLVKYYQHTGNIYHSISPANPEELHLSVSNDLAPVILNSLAGTLNQTMPSFITYDSVFLTTYAWLQSETPCFITVYSMLCLITTFSVITRQSIIIVKNSRQDCTQVLDNQIECIMNMSDV